MVATARSVSRQLQAPPRRRACGVRLPVTVNNGALSERPRVLPAVRRGLRGAGGRQHLVVVVVRSDMGRGVGAGAGSSSTPTIGAHCSGDASPTRALAARLELSPVVLHAEEERVVTEASAQRTLDLLAFVLPPGPLAPGVELALATLSAKPVPMSLIVRIVRAVCAHTGFADDLFADATGAAVLGAIDPDFAAPAGSDPAAPRALSIAAARMMYFQRLSSRIRSTARCPHDPIAPITDEEATATARAIAVEMQNRRAPLALNDFLQDLARAAASHGSSVPTEKLLPPVDAESVHLLPNADDSPSKRLKASASALVAPHFADLQHPATLWTETKPEVGDADGARSDASHESDEDQDQDQPPPRRTGGSSGRLSEKLAGKEKFKSIGERVRKANRATSVFYAEAHIPVRRSMTQKLKDDDVQKLRTDTSERTFITDSKHKFKFGVTRLMIGRTLMRGGATIDVAIKEDIFNRFDASGDGHLDFREIRLALTALGIQEDVEQLRKRIKEHDDDGNDELEFEEFCHLVDDITAQQNSEAATQSGSSRDSHQTRLQNLQRNMRETVDQTQVHFTENRREPATTNVRCFIRRAESNFSCAWDIVQMSLLIWVAFSVTVSVGLDIRESKPNEAMFWIEVSVDVYFLCDLIMQFFTTYIDNRGIEVVRLRKIAKNYIGFPWNRKGRLGWFWIDACSGERET
eukprot:COSAG06_NODE_1840_length_8239_cov_3.113145_7_plen_694_part_00